MSVMLSKEEQEIRTVSLFLMNLAAILAANVTVFSAHVVCCLCRPTDLSRGTERVVRLIQKKSLVKRSLTS